MAVPEGPGACPAPCPSQFDATRAWDPGLAQLLDELARDWHRDGVSREGAETALDERAGGLGWCETGPTLRWRLHGRRADEVDDPELRRAHRVVAGHQLAVRRRRLAAARTMTRLFARAAEAVAASETDAHELARAWARVGAPGDAADAVLPLVELLTGGGQRGVGWTLCSRHAESLAPHDHRARALTWLAVAGAPDSGADYQDAALAEAARCGDGWLQVEVCTAVGLIRRDPEWTARWLARLLPDVSTA